KEAINSNAYVLETIAGSNYIFKKYRDNTWKLNWNVTRNVVIDSEVGGLNVSSNLSEAFPINLDNSFNIISYSINVANKEGLDGVNVFVATSRSISDLDEHVILFRLAKYGNASPGADFMLTFTVHGTWS